MKNSILFLSILFATAGRAQHTTPPLAVGKIVYTRTTTLPGDMQYNGKTTLFFHPERSLFVHNNAPTNALSVNYKELGMTGSVFGDSTGFPILKLHAEKKSGSRNIFRLPDTLI